MSGDPFERFERSRRGFLIPVLLFIVGAMLTTFALSRLDDLVSLQGLADEPPAAVQPAAVQPAAVQPAAIEPAAIEPVIESELDGAIEPAIESEIEDEVEGEVEHENREPSPQ